MASKTVNESCVDELYETETKRPELKAVAHTASDDLFDVLALLNGARSIFQMECGGGGKADRLISQAEDKISAIHTALDPYI